MQCQSNFAVGQENRFHRDDVFLLRDASHLCCTLCVRCGAAGDGLVCSSLQSAWIDSGRRVNLMPMLLDSQVKSSLPKVLTVAGHPLPSEELFRLPGTCLLVTH